MPHAAMPENYPSDGRQHAVRRANGFVAAGLDSSSIESEAAGRALITCSKYDESNIKDGDAEWHG